jgi:SulP family sulfate permease
VRWINPLSTRYWRDDLRGGLRAAAVALPMGLAFGVVSGAGPMAGLYSAIVTGLFAALFGGTATQISGPTGPIAIVMADVFVRFAHEPGAAAGTVLLAGAIQILLGALRFGKYVRLIPYPVAAGFSSGVGSIILIMQLNPLLGQPSANDTLEAVRALPGNIGAANVWAVGIAVATFLAARWMPRKLDIVIPHYLTLLVLGSVIVTASGIAVPHLPAPARLLPELSWPPLTELPWPEIWIAALVLALISSLDSLITSMAADSATQRFHDANRELVGQGIGNAFAALIGVLPGAGSTFRTMANIRGGARTPLSAIFHSLLLLLLVLGAGSLIQYVPTAVLAGILLHIGLGIVDWDYIRRFPQAPRAGVVIMVLVWIMAVFVSVVTAVAVGFVLASLALVKQMADWQLESIELSSDRSATMGLSHAERGLFDQCRGKALLVRLGAPMTFGAASGLTRRLGNIAGYEVLILDLTDVTHIDETATRALEGIIRRALDNGQAVVTIGLHSQVVRAFVRFGLLALIKRCLRYRRRIDALRYSAKLISAEPAKS